MDNIKDIDNSTILCLVCCLKVVKTQENDKLLRKNLLVIFLLKNVLQVPNEQLEENLKRNGNPLEWIQLCEECSQMSRKALDLHCQIVKFDRELWAAQNLIVEKLTKSINSSLNAAVHQNANIWGRTRAIAKKSNFQSGDLPVNPFIEGDKLATANYYLGQVDISTRENLTVHPNNYEKVAKVLKIKIEQLRPQFVSDNEDGCQDDDWPLDQDDDEDSEDNSLKFSNKQPNYPTRIKINGKFKCKFCSKLFFTSSGCSKHEKEKHASVPNQFPCKICGKAWNSNVYLRKHMGRVHKVCLNEGEKLSKPILSTTTEIDKQLEKSDEDNRDELENEKLADKPLPLSNEVKVEPLDAQILNCDADDLECDDVEWQLDEDGGLSDEDKQSRARNLNKSRKRAKKKVRKRINGKTKCYYCDKVFWGVNGCLTHEKEKHASIPAQFPCKLCDRVWNSRGGLYRHVRKVHKKKLAEVEKMEVPLKLVELRKQPTIRERVNGKIKCNYCEKLFTNRSSCCTHENENHPRIPGKFPCEICGKVWNSRQYLMRHRTNAHKMGYAEGKKHVVRKKDKKEEVGLSDKSTKIKINGKFKCKFCSILFFTMSGCWRHEQEKHPTIPNQFPCKICGKAWNSNVYLRKHMGRVHKVFGDRRNKLVKRISKPIRKIGEMVEKTGEDNNQDELEDEKGEKLTEESLPLTNEFKVEHLNEEAVVDFEEKDEDWQLNDDDEDLSDQDKDKEDKQSRARSLKKKKFRKRINGKIKCYFCDKVFSRANTCRRHENERHASILGQFLCKLCGKVWNSLEYLSRHVKRSHRRTLAEIEKMEVPEKISEGSVEIRKEAKVREMVDGKIKCFYCDKLFARSSGCIRHENEIHPEIPGQFPCDICDKVWNSKEYLTKHKRSAHVKEYEEEKETESCGSKAKGSDDLEISLSTEPIEKESEINELDGNEAEFEEDDDLQLDDVRSAGEDEDEDEVKRKMKKVTGLVLKKRQRFPCEICGKEFKRLCDKRQHELIRKGTRFGCRFCDLSFSTRYGVGRHERTSHQDIMSSKSNDFRKMRGWEKLEWVDGKVKCGSCEKWFTSGTSLKNHEISHKYRELVGKGGWKRKFAWVDGKLKCGDCDREFLSERGLLQHEREKHLSEKGEFICELCGKVCETLYILRGHKKRVHKLLVDGSTWKARNYRGRKEDDKEGYGLTLKDGKGKRGKKYLAVDGKLKCRSCDKLFKSDAGVYKHEKEKHPARPGEFICTHCAAAFNSLEYLRVHTERKHWMRMDGTPYIPPWVPTRKYKWKRSEK